MQIAIDEARKRNVDYVRCNLWKPRDKVAFDGLQEEGLHVLGQVARAGLNPALEVMVPEHVTMALEATLPHLNPDGKLLVWIGARNQNHFIQRDIAKVAAENPQVMLMVKNQPWLNDPHWAGIIQHVLSSGLPPERLLNCYRGVAPSYGDKNPEGYRNVVNFEAAMMIKQETGIPLLFDPSHTGGSVPNVFKVAKAAAAYDFDGIIIEIHHDPEHAITDAKQQLTWPQFDELVESMRAASEE
jgi:chorismate mutase